MESARTASHAGRGRVRCGVRPGDAGGSGRDMLRGTFFLVQRANVSSSSCPVRSRTSLRLSRRISVREPSLRSSRRMPLAARRVPALVRRETVVDYFLIHSRDLLRVPRDPQVAEPSRKDVIADSRSISVARRSALTEQRDGQRQCAVSSAIARCSFLFEMPSTAVNSSAASMRSLLSPGSARTRSQTSAWSNAMREAKSSSLTTERSRTQERCSSQGGGRRHWI